jgi:hypothetical protein
MFHKFLQQKRHRKIIKKSVSIELNIKNVNFRKNKKTLISSDSLPVRITPRYSATTYIDLSPTWKITIF